MILLMAIGNGFAALAGRLRPFLPAFLPPPRRAPHGWACRQDAGRHLASVFPGSTSSEASASRALERPLKSHLGTQLTQPWLGAAPRRRRAGREAAARPRRSRHCPKEVTLISPVSQTGKLRPGAQRGDSSRYAGSGPGELAPPKRRSPAWPRLLLLAKVVAKSCRSESDDDTPRVPRLNLKI